MAALNPVPAPNAAPVNFWTDIETIVLIMTRRNTNTVNNNLIFQKIC